MKYPKTVRDHMTRACITVYSKHKLKLKHAIIANVIHKYWGTLRGLMAQGRQDSVLSFPYRFEVPQLGHIRYNPGVLRRRYEVDVDRDVDHDEARNCAKYVLSKGWKLFMWTIKLGYVFRHEETGTFYYLKNKTVKGKLDAYQHFSEIVDSDYVWHNTPVSILEEFKLVYPLTINGYKAYSEIGDFLGSYSTLYIAGKAANAPPRAILSFCLVNQGRKPVDHVPFKGIIWKFGHEVYPKTYAITRYHATKKELGRVSLLNPKTKEVLYKNFGYIGDVIVMINTMRRGKAKINASNILEVLEGKRKSAYGYGYERYIP